MEVLRSPVANRVIFNGFVLSAWPTDVIRGVGCVTNSIGNPRRAMGTHNTGPASGLQYS